jgi:L-alanine-DL-glutamate epimerase-like enolase superfamily enzyme
MKLTFRFFELPLKHTFTISRESHDMQPTLIIKLEKDGHFGLGECTTNPFYNMTVERLGEVLSTVKDVIEALEWNHPEELYDSLVKILPDEPFLRCALDIAAWDLYAKKLGLPLYAIWNLEWVGVPATNYTIGLDTIEVMKAKLKEMPWPIYKIKLGTDEDAAIIDELRKHTDAIFRVDANCAWSADQTIVLSKRLQQLGVEFIEQPVRAYDFEAANSVYHSSVLPIIADESCQTEADVVKCHGNFHGINIKLVKCGGLTPALRMIKNAKALGMSVMVGCMTESSVGISAIAHLLPLLDYVDMDGALLLKRDIAKGVEIEHGVCVQPQGPGTGAVLLDNFDF